MKFSKQVEELIAQCRWTAEKLGNDFISEKHFILVYNNFATNKILDVKVKLSDIKTIIQSIKGEYYGVSKKGNFPLTKHFETALKTSKFHKWIFSSNEILPEHIFLSLMTMLDEPNQKTEYVKILSINKISLSGKKKFAVNILFNPLARKLGLSNLLISLLR